MGEMDCVSLRGGSVQAEIKRSPEDFVVKEMLSQDIVCDGIHKYSPDGSTGKPGAFVFLLNLYNWDQFKALSYIAKSLGINKSCLSFCGTKDKKAVTYQLISIDDVSGVSVKDVSKLSIKDINLTYLGKGERLYLGKSWGNRFSVRVYFDGADTNDVRSLLTDAGNGSFFPNYFGPQRFGTNRPVSHIVGRHLIDCDIKSAVMSYLSVSVPTESKAIRKARGLVKAGEFKEALLAFPDVMHYEKVLLSCLIKNPDDYMGAFRTFPQSMQKMFVHAYQSDLFNRVLSKIVASGDYDMNMEIPLFGYRLKLIKDSRIRIPMQEVLREEDIDLSSFRVDIMPELSSKGGLRNAFERAYNFRCFVSPENYADLDFSLPKGCYATVLLREFFIL